MITEPMYPNIPGTWRFIGTSVSGNGYGYSIYRDDSALGIRHAVRLAIGSVGAYMVEAPSYTGAVDIGQRFCHAWHMWNVVKARNKALADGIAFID